jgi:hypothetical protein
MKRMNSECRVLLFHANYKKITQRVHKDDMTENEISYKIIGAAIEIHKNIGPG